MITGIIFIGLNLADGFLTRIALEMGASEVNPVVSPYGANVVAKGLIALAVVLILYRLRKEKLLWGLNLLFFGIVVLNLAVIAVLGAVARLGEMG